MCPSYGIFDFGVGLITGMFVMIWFFFVILHFERKNK